ncbi:hypothetical protein fugu_003222 [Takifugu bimaculatus]|uniref:C-type lectin domain-containing protein n=1 Tax=Takifugu bimaculatus TaxID=433685 RepID=A0A4Z2BF68_9TELE|nr:hypothetical protein fugu_003222 [Takifugu bimaculatus]
MTGKWYDEKCSESGYGFVCQKLQDTTKSPTHSYHHPLPNNIEYRDHNYRVISGNLSWYNAMVMCRENHFDLVSIMDAYHQAFLTVLVNRLGAPHWIGLHSELPASKPFISNDVVCPTTWVKFGQICYNFDPVVYQLTFEKSREHCRLMANNSDVLTIMSDQENRFVLEQLWTLGLLHQTVWLGMDFNQDNNSMVWVDGSPVDYNNWPNKSPDPKLVFPDTCVTTRGVDGVWHLSQCTEQLGFICKTTTMPSPLQCWGLY